MRRELTVNGLPVTASFADEDVEGVLLPLLRDIARADATRRARDDGSGRTVVLLAAPPGSGKSTLAALLEGLSREAGLVPLCSAGMDGFHFPNAYLDAHGLRSVKGAPETFDVAALTKKLAETRRAAGTVLWPSYSRVSHDVVPDSLAVTGEVVLVEGNYLLLDELAGATSVDGPTSRCSCAPTRACCASAWWRARWPAAWRAPTQRRSMRRATGPTCAACWREACRPT